MSEIKRTQLIQQEIADIKLAVSTMSEKKTALVTFILGPKFLDDYREFNKLLHEYVNSLVILLKDIEEPIVGEGAMLPQPKMFIPNPLNPEQPVAIGMEGQNQQIPDGFSITPTQGAIIIALNLFAWIGTYYMAPNLLMLPAIITSVSFIGAFSDKIARALQGLFNKNKKPESALDLRHWISKSVAEMREEYTETRFDVMQERVTKETNANYIPGEDEELFDLKKQKEETLAQTFISTIDWIDTESNDAASKIKKFYFSLLGGSPQTQPGAPKQ